MTIEPLDKETFLTQMGRAEQAGDFSSKALKRFWDWAYGNDQGAIQTCAFPVPSEDIPDEKLGKGKWVHAMTYDEFKEFCQIHSGMWRYHVYAGVNTLDTIPDGGRGKASHIKQVNHLSFDIETKRESYSGASKESVWWCYKYALAQAKFMNEEYGVWPMVVMSENGIHMHYKVEFETDDGMMLGKSHVYSKYITKQAMECKYANKIKSKTPDSVVIDQDDVSDVPRVMKVPGTKGIKSENGRLCGIIHQPSKQDVGVIKPEQVNVPEDAFDEDEENNSTDSSKNSNTSVDVTPTDASKDVMTRVKSLCKKNEKFKQMFYGDTTGYKSRSEAEMAFAVKMLNHGFKPDEMTEVFWASGMSKWGEESDHYRQRTIDYALDHFDGETVKDSTNGSFSFSRHG